MSAIRQDAWTDDEDLLLAETVLRHIREGSTQLAAFEEVGKALSRTPAACGFRWNSLIRKRYENAISLAKKQRKELSKKNKEGSKKRDRQLVKVVDQSQETLEKTDELTISKVIDFLRYLEGQSMTNKANQQEVAELEQQLEHLKVEKKELLAENQQLKRDFSTIKEDYQALIHIMDRARRFAEPTPMNQTRENEWEEITEALTVNSKKD